MRDCALEEALLVGAPVLAQVGVAPPGADLPLPVVLVRDEPPSLRVHAVGSGMGPTWCGRMSLIVCAAVLLAEPQTNRFEIKKQQRSGCGMKLRVSASDTVR